MNWFLCIAVFVVALFGSCKARCDFPGHRKNGYMVCNSLNYLEGDKCRVDCEGGYRLKGANDAVCKDDQWTATIGECEAVICPVPKASRLTISNPENCLTGPSPYSTHCDLTCPPGYPDRALFYCNASGQWEGRDVECIDYESPVIKCPKDLTVIETDPGQATAKIRFPKPSYSDNSESHGGKVDFYATLDNNERVSVSEEHELSIGHHYVRYYVSDEAANKRGCFFRYRVVDNEPPKIQHCPRNITKMTKAGFDYTRVSWPQDPSASDNSGNVHVFYNRVKNTDFYVGTSLVEYKFYDNADNFAICKFYVIVEMTPHPCVDWMDICSTVASAPEKCDEALYPQTPELKWKNVCRKSCNAC